MLNVVDESNAANLDSNKARWCSILDLLLITEDVKKLVLLDEAPELAMTDLGCLACSLGGSMWPSQYPCVDTFAGGKSCGLDLAESLEVTSDTLGLSSNWTCCRPRSCATD